MPSLRIYKKRLKKLLPLFQKLPRTLAEKAFLTFLALLFFSLSLGGFIFYRYSILAEPTPEINGGEEPLKFKEKVYQEILEIWQEKDIKFELTNSKKYSDPFREKKEEAFELIPESTPETEEEEISEPATDLREKLLATTNLTEFYLIKGEKLPSVRERAIIWEMKGLGSAVEYYGSNYQNQRLLEALKQELTQ